MDWTLLIKQPMVSNYLGPCRANAYVEWTVWNVSKSGVFKVFHAKDPQTERWSRDPLLYRLYKIVFYIKLGLVQCVNIATLLMCIQY